MGIFQGQPPQLPELVLHVAPSWEVYWAKLALEQARALPALGQDASILHLNRDLNGSMYVGGGDKVPPSNFLLRSRSIDFFPVAAADPAE